MFHVPEEFRCQNGPMASTASAGNNGAFYVKQKSLRLRVIASDGMGWEHVSASLPDRCPTWEEMCFIKAMFWDEEDTVLQFHPPRSNYVNYHPYCLHLWRPTNQPVPLPPSYMVGPKGESHVVAHR